MAEASSLKEVRPSPALAAPPARPARPQAVTGYSRARLAGCASALYDLHRTADVAALQAVREKYSSRRFFGVSTLQPAPSSPVAA